MIAPTRTREQLIATWKRLSRALADEHLPESDAAALRRERELVQAEIDALDATPPSRSVLR